MDYLYNLSNKKFIFRCLDIMKEHNALDEQTIGILTNKERCLDMFCNYYSILQEVGISGAVPKDMYYDATGHRRYYPDKYYIKDKAYIVTNDWYYTNKVKKDNRTPFIKWLRMKVL